MSERVDKSKIYERFTRVTKQTKDLVDSMEELQAMMTAVLEENAELSIENEHLHQMLKQKHQQATKDGLTDSRRNLQKLYQEGFHVCNEYYGKRLDEDDSCAFCLDAIYGRHGQPQK